jgi:hypothetical protein
MLLQKRLDPDRSAIAKVDRIPAPFIVGHARSGTTLLRLMLDAHPDLAIPDETHFIPRVIERCRTDANPRAAFLEILLGHPAWPSFLIPEDAFAEQVGRLDPFDVGEALRVFFRFYAARFDKPRWGEKTPGYLEHMHLIQEVLPESRFIHIIRDGRDVALSWQGVSRGNVTVEQVAHRWMRQLWLARGQVEALDYYLEIRYEDLIDDAEPVLRTICDFVELPWDAGMLTYYERSMERLSEKDLAVRPRESDIVQRGWRDNHALTERPPQSDRVAVWKREMPPADRELFAEIAGEALATFGYEV